MVFATEILRLKIFKILLFQPENFLLLTKADDSPIKVIDFGLSIIFNDQNSKTKDKVVMTTRAGTVIN